MKEFIGFIKVILIRVSQNLNYVLIGKFKTDNKHQKICLFAQGRTGSSLLVDLLNSHPQLTFEGELLNPNFKVGTSRYRDAKILPLSFLEGKFQKSKSHFGFKVKIYQLDQQYFVSNTAAFIHQLAKNNWKIIYLWRANHFEHAMSNIVATENQLFHLKKKHNLSRIHVDINELNRIMNERIEFRKRELGILENIPHFELEYKSDLLTIDQNKLRDLCSHLGIEDIKLSSELRKIVDKSYEELIENYEEVKSFLTANNWQHYL